MGAKALTLSVGVSNNWCHTTSNRSSHTVCCTRGEVLHLTGSLLFLAFLLLTSSSILFHMLGAIWAVFQPRWKAYLKCGDSSHVTNGLLDRAHSLIPCTLTTVFIVDGGCTSIGEAQRTNFGTGLRGSVFFYSTLLRQFGLSLVIWVTYFNDKRRELAKGSWEPRKPEEQEHTSDSTNSRLHSRSSRVDVGLESRGLILGGHFIWFGFV